MKHVKAWKKIEAKLCPALIFSSFIFKFLRNLVGACKITFQGKVQKHQALEAEVAANEDRVTSVLNVGRGKRYANKVSIFSSCFTLVLKKPRKTLYSKDKFGIPLYFRFDWAK